MSRFKKPNIKALLQSIPNRTYDWEIDKVNQGLMQASILIGKVNYLISLAAYQIIFKSSNTSCIILDGIFKHTDPNNYNIYKNRYNLIAHMAIAMDQFTKRSVQHVPMTINGYTFGTTKLPNIAPVNVINRMYKDISEYYEEMNKGNGKPISRYPFTHNGVSFNLHLGTKLPTEYVDDITRDNISITMI